MTTPLFPTGFMAICCIYMATMTNMKAQSTAPTELPPNFQTIIDQMIFVEGGTFTMGCTADQGDDCNDETPISSVNLSDFYIGRYEVTQAQWRAVMGSVVRVFNRGCDQCPVENISRKEVQEFIDRVNSQTGYTFRLPTEAEWEYAARGGNKTHGFMYSGSDDLDEVAWYFKNAQKGNTHGIQYSTRPVGGKKPNELGLYDMSGNVWEWCNDWYGDYTSGDKRNPKGPSSGDYHVFRGGCWHSNTGNCRVSRRDVSRPTGRSINLGFRLARDS